MELAAEGYMLPCKHSFHTTCIMPWLELNNTCPGTYHLIEVCRREYPTDVEEKNKVLPAVSAEDDEEPWDPFFG
jgi:E3 ubiquitin-protein ligase RNF115/126